MARRTFHRKQCLEKEVKDLYLETEYTAVAAASGTLDLTNDVTISAVATGSSNNGNTITTNVNAAAANPTDTVLAAVTGTAAAIDIEVTPNDGTNNSAVASGATSGLSNEITFKSVTASDRRNGDMVVIAVEPDNDNPTDTVLVEALGTEDVTVLKVTPNDGTNNPASTNATASLATSTPIALTSAKESDLGDGDTFTSQVLAAAANPTDTVLASFTGTETDVICTVTPNDGTNNPIAQATASMATSTPIVLTSVAAGSARNTNTFTSQVLAAAANPTDTVLAAFTGTADAITCTITPNDGTNNPNAAATATLATTTPIVLTSVAPGTGRNGEAFTIQVAAAAANPTDTVLAAFTEAAGDITVTVTPNDGTNNPVAQATATLATTTPIVLTSVAAGTDRNGDNFQVTVNAAAANPTDTVLATFTNPAGDDIDVAVTPNDGTNNPANATATATSYGYDTEIVLTKASAGAGENGDTYKIDIAAAAANSDDKVLIAWTGTADATVVTVTPNDGTNNGGIPIYPSTERIVECINTGAVAGQDWVVTDVGGIRTDVTATGGDNQLLQNGDPCDLMFMTFAGGTTVTVGLTTAELVELINTGSVAGKNVTVTDVPVVRALQTATGGDATALANGGEGDGTNDNFAGGTNPAVDLTTAELVELINTGTVAAKNVTLTDLSAVRDLQTATGGDATALADAGEGDGVTDNFAGGTDTAVTITTAELVELINTGSVAGKTVTVTDASGFRALQTATGGAADDLADAGEGDNVVGTFSGGTNPSVTLTTAELVELINTGSVAGKTVTVTDASSLRDNQTATGGAADDLADGGEGDGLVANFSGGVKVPINLTTAQLAELINSGSVVGVNVTLTDTGSILTDLDATGGGAQNLADAGEGDGVMATLSGGYATPVNLTTAELAELIRTGSVAGKTVTLSGTPALLNAITATGGGSENLADSGEGDGKVATLSGGTDAASFSNTTKWGIESIAETATGTFRITFQDKYASLKFFDAVVKSSSERDLNVQLKAEDTNGSTPYIDFYTLTAGSATNPQTGDVIKCEIEVKNTSII